MRGEMKLKGKSAIVTGAASGIGKAIARVYAREGAKLAIADLNKDAAEATANEIRASGGQAIGIAMDVTDERAVNDGVAAVVATFGGVDILVSNAGIQIVHPIEEFSYAEWKKMLAIHVDGEFTTVDDVAEVALFFASFPTNALTGQSLVVSHGWFMQ